MNIENMVPPGRKQGSGAIARRIAQESGSSSPARALIAALACLLLLPISLSGSFVTECADAATWPVSTSSLSASVSFRQTYSAGDQCYVHSGIDIPASAGMQISSPLAGTVRYTGSVPSGDSRTGDSGSDKTMNAVSIEVDEGCVITLMPLSSIFVSEGQHVSEGACVGVLAAAGDVSSATTHVHMGYKKGRAYLDPMQLFASATSSAATSASEAQPTEALEHAASPVASTTSSPVEAEGALQPQAAEGASVLAESYVPGIIETGEYAWTPRSQERVSLGSVLDDALGPVLRACRAQFEALGEALGSLSKATGVPLSVLVSGLCILAAVATIALVLVIAHLAAPRIREIWSFQRQRLSARAGGDSMHKLFPASGDAFMSRSRIARGR